jgi:thymidylate synthase (FAD)
MFEPCRIELLETFGSDLTVVNAARVSLGKEVKEMTEKDGRLIRYLTDHDHVSPFFHPQARFRLKMPIWMAREWFRHTIGFARNEVSRRYVDDPPTFHALTVESMRARAPNKKQGSLDAQVYNAEIALEEYQRACEAAMNSYDMLLNCTVAPEVSRMVLPQSMMTEFIETGSLAAYARLVNLRTSPDAQLEIRQVAEEVSTLLAAAFPVSWAALRREAATHAGASTGSEAAAPTHAPPPSSA